MPVVTITAAPHPQLGALLLWVADAIAEAIGVGAGDVIVTHVASGASAVSGADAAASFSSWPIVSIHGSDRGKATMDAALAAAEAAVRAWAGRHDVPCEGVWKQWLTA